MNVNLSTQIEALLLRLAQSGGIRGRISDQQLLELLDQVSESGLSFVQVVKHAYVARQKHHKEKEAVRRKAGSW